ncbi:hypothetical protein H6G74_17125 [Nostoc spongiaeforme FACHB-130]|uniref:Uncharacterized protein n=1 Tax=Nostoc spongiaeforme FACHB-130 TaxID=1357510 RepID=A0ABR8FXY0_9NOSO|nr:hypothetical protein [Nostoc spongiaeforme]MBD2596034.1 hypothetical protein [Nostoc spongiaeforme FACHB-130]
MEDLILSNPLLLEHDSRIKDLEYFEVLALEFGLKPKNDEAWLAEIQAECDFYDTVKGSLPEYRAWIDEIIRQYPLKSD